MTKKIKCLFLLGLCSCVTQDEINFCKANGYSYATYRLGFGVSCTSDSVPIIEIFNKRSEAADDEEN